VTDELIARVRTEGVGVDGLLDRFTRRGDVRVAGRAQPVTVWTAERSGAVAPGPSSETG